MGCGRKHSKLRTTLCLLVDLGRRSAWNVALKFRKSAWHQALCSVTAGWSTRTAVSRFVLIQGFQDVVAGIHAPVIVAKVGDSEVRVSELWVIQKWDPVRNWSVPGSPHLS